MNPSEITVIVYRAKGLRSKRKNKHKYNATFGIGNNKAKSDNVDDAEGNPEWNTEGQLNVDDPMEALIIKIKDKDDILGQISLHMHELPNSKPSRPKSIPLQPHKKCPNPEGDVVFEAWISNYSDHVPTLSGKSKQKEKNLASQMGKLRNAGLHGSRESIDSTVSGFSTMSEATKKKSALKKLKGAFKHSPKLGSKSKMHSKTSAQSCMDLTYGQGNLSVQNIDFKGSNESLASQTSELSKISEGKKSSSPFKKLKNKMGKSPLTGRKEFTLSKKNSSSMHDLALGGQGLSVPRTGSSESIEKLGKSSRMDSSFPNKFDLTAPTALIQRLAAQEEAEKERKQKEKEEEQKRKNEKEDTVSIHSGDGASPKPTQRRRLSVQTRSLRDDPRLRKAPANGSPLLGRQVEPRLIDTISPVSSKENIRGPTLGSSNENVSVTPDNVRREKLNSDGDARSIRSTNSSEIDQNHIPFYMTTPPPKKKLTSERPLPEITGVSPSQGTTEGGTKVTIRGKNLGLDKADVVCLNVCGANCLASLEYVSDRKLQIVTKPWKAISGKLIVETQSGGRANSLVEFTFVDFTNKPPPSPVIPSHNESSSSEPPAVSVFDEYGATAYGEKLTPPPKPKRSPNAIPKNQAMHSIIPEDEPIPEASFKKLPPPPKPVRVSKSPESSPRRSKSPEDKRRVSKSPEESRRVSKSPEASPQPKKSIAPLPPQPSRSPSPTPKNMKKKVVIEPNPPISLKSMEPPSPAPLEGQERQEPEGMTEMKLHKSPVAKHVDVFSKERESPLKEGRRQILPPDSDEGIPSKTELMDMIRQLQQEKTALQQENASMKGYMDKIIDKVIDRCPDVLCIDPNGGPARSPIKLP